MIITVLWLRKPGHREVKSLAQSHTAGKQRCRNANTGGLNPKPSLKMVCFLAMLLYRKPGSSLLEPVCVLTARLGRKQDLGVSEASHLAPCSLAAFNPLFSGSYRNFEGIGTYLSEPGLRRRPRWGGKEVRGFQEVREITSSRVFSLPRSHLFDFPVLRSALKRIMFYW